MTIRPDIPRKLNGKKRLATFGAVIALAASVVPAHAQDGDGQAGAVFAEFETAGTQVSDQELAEIRGKFIKSDSISFFGISMITSWQDGSGVTTVARLVFNVDFLSNGDGGDPTPRLMVGWVRDGDPSLDVANNHSGYTPLLVAQDVLPVGGLGETSGAAQANIIAGADNAALNGLQIALVPSSSLQQFGTDGLTPISETLTQNFIDGDQLEFRLGANELGLVMTGNNGSDSTMQNVGGELGRMLQQTVLSSDGNSVLNNTAIVIGAEMGAGTFDAIRATEALSSMKGHGF